MGQRRACSGSWIEKSAYSVEDHLTMAEQVLRQVRPEEFSLFVKYWLQNYPWCGTAQTYLAMYEFTRENSICAVDQNDVPIGFAVGVKLNDRQAFAGCLVVEEAWKGKGLGRLLFKDTILRKFCDYNLGINAVEDKQDMYQKMGFNIISFSILEMAGIPNASTLEIIVTNNFRVEPFKMDKVEQLIEYDSEIHAGIKRSTLVKSYLHIEQAQTYVAINKNSNIIGYTNFLPAAGKYDYCLNPLYGDTPEVTKQLFAEALKILPPGKSLHLPVPEENATSVAMLKSVGLEVVGREVRMYTKEDVSLQLHKISSTLTPNAGLC